ncbi:MAG: V-type ATP synthase subunit D [Candidatus Thermoplasmatota archaeon]
MPEEIIEGVNPTRMDLLEIRKKLLLADKGHDLLEEKRDTLIERFFLLMEHRDKVRSLVEGKLKESFLHLSKAQMILGEEQVSRLALLAGRIDDIVLEYDNVMGVRVPRVKSMRSNDELDMFFTGLSGSCAAVDEAYKSFREVGKYLIELAEIEGGIRALALEIEKTKRRVNVLENVLIPRLKETVKYIEMQLDEREREDFFRRKRIKNILEVKKTREDVD